MLEGKMGGRVGQLVSVGLFGQTNLPGAGVFQFVVCLQFVQTLLVTGDRRTSLLTN